MRIARLAAAVSALAAVATSAGQESTRAEIQDREASDQLETVTIIGSLEDVDNTAGGAHFIEAEQLARFAYADVQRLLRQLPGVSIQVEDATGCVPTSVFAAWRRSAAPASRCSKTAC